MFEYNAEIIEVVDGDTVSAKIDLGFRINWTIRLRLFGINAPELRSTDETEQAMAQKAKARLTELTQGKKAVIKTYKDRTEKYGRYLAEINCEGRNVNQQLIAENLATPYLDRKR